MVDGRERFVDAGAAQAAGYTLVDLSDGWTPFIFAEQPGPDGQAMPNRYRRVFVGLANDTLDDDGQPLEAGRKNYLELYGIPPSLSVLRARFLEDATLDCHRDLDVAALAAVEDLAHLSADRLLRREWRRERLVKDVEEARTKGESGRQIDAKSRWLADYTAEQRALAEVEKRLACEGMLGLKDKHKPGVYDDPLVTAIRRFQHENKIYESSYRLRRTLQALAATPLANDYQTLTRVLTERVVDAASILEDGSTKGGKNLVDEHARVTLDQLGWTSPEAALDFFRRHPQADFTRLRAAIRLPAPPEHYAPHMDLSFLIDPGDVWYEPLFDAKGGLRNPSRDRFPSFTVLAKQQGRAVPLVRWRTTVGGWRSEQASDGYEYYRYKGSDIGPRVIRRVVAGPVWIAPESTPIRTMVKRKYVDHVLQPVVDYDEIGPGYRSAYGVVAGYFVVPGRNGRPDWDKGIRAHGSSEYLSMYSNSGYSHGCHRLPNHLAIRLYSFVLRHRTMRPAGDDPSRYSRQFLKDDEVFELRIPSRGFVFELDPPLPVEVLEGNVRGKEKEPITVYIPKPGVKYPGPPPPVRDGTEARAGGAAGVGEPQEEEEAP